MNVRVFGTYSQFSPPCLFRCLECDKNDKIRARLFQLGTEGLEIRHAVSCHSSAIKRLRRTVITAGVFNLHDNTAARPSARVFLHIVRARDGSGKYRASGNRLLIEIYLVEKSGFAYAMPRELLIYHLTFTRASATFYTCI